MLVGSLITCVNPYPREVEELKPGIIHLLRCPDCGNHLSLRVSRQFDGEIEEGSLSCLKCHQSFPIVRFIPRFVSSDKYVRSFSAQWNIFPTTQLDSEQKTESMETFLQKTGLKTEDTAGKLVLEAGCGMGRFIEVVSRQPTATVIGFDLSQAVEAAFRNVGKRANVHIIQADIMKTPFARESFDIVFSIGVLHHTPDPRQAFKSLVPLLRKNGEIAIWVYQKYRRPPLSDLYRILTTRMPWSMVLSISRVLVKLHGLHQRIPHLWHIIPISMHEDPSWRLLDTFDWYSPKHQFKFTTGQVLVWFREMSLNDIHIQPTPVSVRARR